jgi:hypothetical protein
VKWKEHSGNTVVDGKVQNVSFIADLSTAAKNLTKRGGTAKLKKKT